MCHENIIKTQDDHQPVYFRPVGDSTGFFKLTEGASASWISDGSEFDIQTVRTRIEPWLTALFQSEHLSLLVGSGLTHAVHHLAAEKGAAGMDTVEWPEDYADVIKSKANASAGKAGRKEGNLEDQLRIANELLRGLEILDDDKAGDLGQKLIRILDEFAISILQSEKNIAAAESEQREQAFNTLVTFLMSFASRTGTRDRLNIFTTNYDRLIETGAELAGLHLLDRFVGNLTPLFRTSRLDLDIHYNPPGIRGEPRYLEGVARFTKLHGSLDWVQVDDDIRRIGLPFGADKIEPYLQAPGLKGASSQQLMIYPNAAKDRETADYPYVELFRDLAAAICRPNSTLVTYGYSFGDEHINRIIRDMLTIPSAHLVIISYNDPLGRIMKMYEELGRPSQISLLIGPELSDLPILTEHFLPKAAIDKTTFRMGDLLKRRMGAESKSNMIEQPQGDAEQ
ncbi:MAG: fibronectin-binding protein (FBP) [Gammaproteobacteria bacterium]|nr:MAG: fibronectin-binding protein (FBP) [Gammaproteobacteria bacterium]